ncbi:uncharacterized protein LOC141595376 [Silene latifolia]|uniref:uncharacterized protein LOC141595376 n=1 Tax=Silene latifolia TaxID=37657 RepID=UPI003D76B931
MSDRQKGLVDALKFVVPKAEIRFCARHIWANFKLTWSGQVYKEAFWTAARALTQADFDKAMEGMKFLSKEAYAYLRAIPAQHWSMHAFGKQAKSNMLLNNICESFNAVIREARDKPILTHMEWMRRYVMKRMYEKREGVKKYNEEYMPYVDKSLKWAIDESRFCKFIGSSLNVYEVDFHGEQVVVNIEARTCDCNHWQLTGGTVAAYVDEVYSKAKYVLAYEPVVAPIPGQKLWEKTGLPEPLPPAERVMPGRPKSKKRRKEPGEDDGKGSLATTKELARTPQWPPTPKSKGGRPQKSTAWAKEARQIAEKRKATKEGYLRCTGSTSNIQHSAVTTDGQANGTQQSVVRDHELFN